MARISTSFFTSSALVAVSALLFAMVNAQASNNELSQYNSANRTMSVNATWCIIPITKAVAASISGYQPLNIPIDILPDFPAGYHPLLISSGYDNDIRMSPLGLVPLQIASLMQASVLVPYLDVTKDGMTPVNVPINSYVGGTNGNTLAALIPSIASTISPFEGTTAFAATFVPDNAAVMSNPGGFYTTEVKTSNVPNTLSGPGVYAEAIDLVYQIVESSVYTAHTFHALINYPQLLNTGNCQRNTIYFNSTQAFPHMAKGNLTLYHSLPGSPPSAIAGQYLDQYCYQANGQLVAGLGETCAQAAVNYDPTSRE